MAETLVIWRPSPPRVWRGAAGRAATPTHSYNEESEWDVSGANAVDPASLFGARDEL